MAILSKINPKSLFFSAAASLSFLMPFFIHADSAEDSLAKQTIQDKKHSCDSSDSSRRCCRGPRGPRGARGPTGPRGPAGLPGPTGATGATGSGSGAIIPFASGGTFTLFDNSDGPSGAAIAFGNHIDGISPLTPSIDISIVSNMSFSMPSDGTLTSISAFFNSNTVGGPYSGNITITAQVYTSTAPNNIFTPLPGALVNLPSFNSLNIGDTFNGITTGLNIPLSAQDRVLVVFSAASSVEGAGDNIDGYGSAGLKIE